MGRKPEITKEKRAPVVAVRFDPDVIEIVDMLSDNRSKFVREGTYEKIEREMEKRGKNE